MEEFNSDNEKIEAALKERNCQFYTTSYIGTGEMKFTLTFPKKPAIFFISRVNAANLSVGVQGSTHTKRLISARKCSAMAESFPQPTSAHRP